MKKSENNEVFRNCSKFKSMEKKDHILRTVFLGKEASTPIMEYQVFLCIFYKNSAMATLGRDSRFEGIFPFPSNLR